MVLITLRSKIFTSRIGGETNIYYDFSLTFSTIPTPITIITGVRELPAICTAGHTLSQLSCESYEVAMCDPLHDFKNLIHHILEELPHQVNTRDLKKDITDFCKGSLGRLNEL